MSTVISNSSLNIDLASAPDLATVVRPRLPLTTLDPAAGRLHQILKEPAIQIARRTLMGGFLLHLPRLAWMIFDIIVVSSGTIIGHNLFVWWEPSPVTFVDLNLWIASGILSSCIVLAGSMFGLYETSTLWSRSRIVARCLMTVTVAMAATWLIMHLLMYSTLSRRAAATGVVIFLFNASLVRLLAHQAVREVRRGLLVIGQGPLTGRIIRSVQRGSVPGYRLVGVVHPEAAAHHDYGVSDIPFVGDIQSVEDVCRQHDVAEVVVSEGSMHNPSDVRAAMDCLKLGCRVTDETTFFESLYYEVPVSHITPHWFLAADLKGQRQEHSVAKRVFDILASAIGLLVGAPLFVIIAIVVKLSDGGPALYSQRRVGQGGRVFTLHKFRTMRADAEAGGTAWASANDPRVTPVGRWLRKLRFDELPQLWNILRGDMSVVGPRPERPEFVSPLCSLIPFYDQRHLMKPGLTGWAQINLGYGATIADARRKLQLDLYYIKHTSLELDLIILLRTFGTFCLGSR